MTNDIHESNPRTMSENQEHQGAQPEEPEETLENEQPAQSEQPEYRSYYHKKGGQLPPPQLKKGDKVRFRLSKTQSPLWTIDEVIYDKTLKQNIYRLQKTDGTLHSPAVQRDKLTLENS